MNYSMSTIVLLILIVSLCCYVPVKSQLPSTYQLLDTDDEYLDPSGQYSSSTIQHKLHIPHYNYKDKFRWNKRVPPYITGGIRY
uniref:SJCHGC09751 protein n=1 Tax=Schistosoma japonicum TaxID=6182 RepID=Q5BQZ2_SCHJA|nr:SJCHGC09751 protein [Schistosoma japonicum]